MDTSELQSSDENTSNQSSESVSVESEDTTSEESNSQSDEDDQLTSIAETRDNSMSSEENVRKRLVQVFASVDIDLSAEDNSSTEVKGQPEHLSSELTEKQLTSTSSSTVNQKSKTVQGHTKLQLAQNPTGSSETTSTDTTDLTAVTAATSDSSQSTSSESTETSDSSNESKSTEDSNASDSTELAQIKTQDCVNGTQSCESEEQFFQNMGDDAHYSENNLMVPDEDERELSLRR
ncbi:hypothetical protein Q5P01_025270 [Channa striata]|uniref:Uncharacterized protein n=1 Tax=Channa striata TaxID=64152 RepID=A0AA88LI28_CHASR|nr:hypothetical protein Q5P01_025270 [Channa striata]